jgi:hypothetical protein
MVTTFGLPIFLLIEGIHFMKDDTLRTSSELKHQVSATYPNITVCYPRYFDKFKMQGNDFTCTTVKLVYNET